MALSSSHRPGVDPDLPELVSVRGFELELIRLVQGIKNSQAIAWLLTSLLKIVLEGGDASKQIMALAEGSQDYKDLLPCALSLTESIEDVKRRTRAEAKAVETNRAIKEEFIAELRNPANSYVIGSDEMTILYEAKKTDYKKFDEIFPVLARKLGGKKVSRFSATEIEMKAKDTGIKYGQIKDYTHPGRVGHSNPAPTFLVTSDGLRVLFDHCEDYSAIWTDAPENRPQWPVNIPE